MLITSEGDTGLFAVERVRRQTYALCRLGAWVHVHDLTCCASILYEGNLPQRKRHARQPVESGKPWWIKTVVQPARTGPNDGQPRLDLRAPSLLVDSIQSDVAGALDPNDGPVQSIHETQEEATSKPQSAFELLQELARQYMDALYISRTSLAYFTKGPLSRARAAFCGEVDTELHVNKLMTFFRETILTTTVMDKKYRDTVQNAVKELPIASLATPEPPTKAKKKRKWKSKRDKYGLFMDERDHLERWWRCGDGLFDASSSADSVDAMLKRRIPRVRERETYLQIILLLELLALEATHPCPPGYEPTVAGPDSQAHDTQAQESQPRAAAKRLKPNKQHDLGALLETLLDKLCIWHSLDGHSPAKKLTAESKDADSGNDDELRSFCVEVVIPFYVSRIPQHAATVNQKLGGPSGPTPTKRQSTAARRPGDPATRQAPEKHPRKPLARVSTDTLNRSSRLPPPLLRAATDSAALERHIKREASEPASLDSIPPSLPAPRKRTSLLHSLSFSKGCREVDLSAMSQITDAKMRKKAETDEKLREAVAAIKKPNRALANKEVAESADLSFAKATAKTRPRASGPVASGPQAVDVQATPKHGKSVKATPTHYSAMPSTQTLFTGGTSRVPSSSARFKAPLQPQTIENVPASSFAIPHTGHRQRQLTNIESTPSRGFAKFMPTGLAHEPGGLRDAKSPIATRQTAVVATPMRAVKSLMLKPPQIKATARIERPRSPSLEAAVVRAVPTTPAGPMRNQTRTARAAEIDPPFSAPSQLHQTPQKAVHKADVGRPTSALMATSHNVKSAQALASASPAASPDLDPNALYGWDQEYEELT